MVDDLDKGKVVLMKYKTVKEIELIKDLNDFVSDNVLDDSDQINIPISS